MSPKYSPSHPALHCEGGKTIARSNNGFSLGSRAVESRLDRITAAREPLGARAQDLCPAKGYPLEPKMTIERHAANN
jgi:hypothetical protein